MRVVLGRQWFGLVASVVLFSSGCDVMSSKDDRLVGAARNDDVTRIEQLLKNGANVNGREKGMLGQTPLVAAAATDGTNAFYLLLRRGANINTPAADGTTPLMEAVILGDANRARVAELIRRGANVNAVDRDKNSVLAHARAAGCQLIIQDLTAAGAKQ